MEIIEYVELLDNKITNINKNYQYIYNNIHNYIQNGKLNFDQLIGFEISLSDLDINISSLVFLFKQLEINDFINKENKNVNINGIVNEPNYCDFIEKYNTKYNTHDKIDYAIDKTIFHFLPLLFIYFMIFDKESILYIKDFVENTNTAKKETTTNTIPIPITITKQEILDDLD